MFRVTVIGRSKIYNQLNKDPCTSEQLKCYPTNKQVYTCDLCAASYTDIHTLAYHLTCHTGKLLYYVKEDYTNDYETVREKTEPNHDIKIRTYSCETISNNSAVKISKVSDKISEVFRCHICGARFFSKLILKKHEQTHRKQRHSNTHTKCPNQEKPFNCKICSAPFATPCQLIQHFKIHNLGTA